MTIELYKHSRESCEKNNRELTSSEKNNRELTSSEKNNRELTSSEKNKDTYLKYWRDNEQI